MHTGWKVSGNSRIALLTLIASPSLFLLACSTKASDEYTDASAPTNQQISQPIGPAGGIIQVPPGSDPLSGITLEIPPGALDSDTTITIAVPDSAPPIPPDALQASKVFSFAPDGLSFAVPVTITIPYDPSLAIAEDSLQVYVYEDSGWEYETLIGRDPQSHTLTIATRHFSNRVLLQATSTNYDTTFDVTRNGFRIYNDLTVSSGLAQSPGWCFGMAAYSRWLFINHKDLSLYNCFGQSVQNRIAQDAQSETLSDNNYLNSWAGSQPGTPNIVAGLMQALATTHQPQILLIREALPDLSYGYHAVLVYGYDAVHGFHIYDPNYPGVSDINIPVTVDGYLGDYPPGTVQSSYIHASSSVLETESDAMEGVYNSNPAPSCSNSVCCDGVCVDTTGDTNNCGGCRKTCDTGQSCCSSACTDTTTDSRNCGLCQHPCGAGEHCAQTSAGIQCSDPSFVQSRQKTLVLSAAQSSSPHNRQDLFAKIDYPLADSLVRADVPIFGLAYGRSFSSYRLEYGKGTTPSTWISIAQSTRPQASNMTPADIDDSADITIHGSLGNWDTGLKNYVYLPSYPKDHPTDLKGIYTVRLVVAGNDGKTVEDRVTLEVGDVIPNAWGGKVTSSDDKVVLDVPEQSLMNSFRLVAIRPAGGMVPSVPADRKLVGEVYAVREAGEKFTKGVRLTFKLGQDSASRNGIKDLGVYAFSKHEKKWVHLDSVYPSGNDSVYAEGIRELSPYYALMKGGALGQGSRTEESPLEGRIVTAATPFDMHFLVKDNFEQDTGRWSNRDGEVGAAVSIDRKATFDGTGCLKVTNINKGGNMAVNILDRSFDVREFPLLQFDYRVRKGVKTNFLVKVSGRWYEVGFTGDSRDLKDKRVNIAHIGDIAAVVADDRWHSANCNLYDMLRTKTGNTRVDEIVMADWRVDGFMKLRFGSNTAGSTYYIDNFAISRDATDGLRLNGDTIVVDNFNQKKLTNALNGSTTTFKGNQGSMMVEFVERHDAGKGNALKLAYDVSPASSFAGYVSSLPSLDLRAFQAVNLQVRCDPECGGLLLGIADSSGHESKVPLTSYLKGGPDPDRWRRVTVPLVAFGGVSDWARIANISIGIGNGRVNRGVAYVDDIGFTKALSSFVVNDFEDSDEVNSLKRRQQLFSSGAAAISGNRTTSSPNRIYRISYGGNIGKVKAYATDIFSYAGWSTEVGGVNCAGFDAVRFRIRGAEGGERPNVHLSDGNFRWGVDIEKYAAVTREWQEVTIPLKDFSEFGVDLTHIQELAFVFEWEKMSGTIYIDDVRFISSSRTAEGI